MADGASIAKNAKGKSLGAQGDSCPYCDRLGLPLLPLRFAYPGPGAPKDKVQSDAKHGKYLNRILSDGFVYLYDERTSEGWRCFAVTKDGYLREYPVEQRPKGTVTFQCSRKGDASLASIINIRNPRQAGKVWIAYTSVWWTKTIRDNYTTNPSPRMQALDVPQLLAGTLPAGMFKIDPLGTTLEQKVAEYAGEAGAFVQSTVSGIERSGQAPDLGKAVDAILPGKAIAVGLYDPVGLVQEIRHYANAAQGRLAALDAKYARELWNANAIDQLQKSFEKAGKAADWAEDYQPKIDSAKLRQFRTNYDKLRMPLIAARDDLCGDYVRWLKSDYFKQARDHDFDNNDGCSCRHFVQQMAEVLNGTGLNYNERQYALQALQNANADNLWLRTLTGNQKTLLAFIAKDKTDGLNDMGKNLYAAVDEWEKTYDKVAKELGLREGAKLTAAQAAASDMAMADQYFRWTLSGEQAVHNAVQTVMQNLQSFVTDVKLAGLRQIRIALFAGYLWLRVKFPPTVLDTTLAQELRRQKTEVWGNSSLSSRLASEAIEDGKRFTMNVGDITDELGEAGHTPVRRVTIAWMLIVEVEPGTSQQQIVDLMHQRHWVAGTGAAADPAVSALPRATQALEESNGVLKFLKAGGANGLFCAFAGYFQIVAIGEANEALAKAKSGTDHMSAVAKLGSAYMALGGAVVEGTFSLIPAIKGMPAESLNIAGGMSAARLAALGGVIGGVAGIIGGITTISDGAKAKREGEAETGNYLRAGGYVLAAGGVFSSIGAGIALFDVAGGILFGLGPGGWAILAIGATVVALVFVFEGEQARSNAYQNWLRKAWFGKDQDNAEVSYKSPKEEAVGFGALFQLPLKIDFKWRKGLLGGNVNVDIRTPALGSGSWLNYGIAFVTSGGQILKGAENRVLGGSLPSYADMITPQLKVHESPTGAVYSPRVDGATWHLDWFASDEIKQVAVKLSYWPDKAHNPDIELPDAGGKLFTSTAQDGGKKE